MSSTLARHATRQRAASDIAMQIGVRLVNLALGAVVTALVVRTLGSAGYGRWSTLFVVWTLVGYFANFGLESVALREAAREPEREHEWIGTVIALRLMLLGPVMLVCFGVLVLLPHTEQMLIAGAILVVTMPFGGVSALGLLFRLRVDNRIPMVVLTLRSVLWGAAVLVIYLEHGGLVPLAIAMSATNLIGTFVGAMAALRIAERRPRPTTKHLRQLVRVATPVGISGVLILAYGQIDQVIVYSIAGTRDAGLYGAVYNLLNQSHFVPISILTTLSPVLAASWPRDPARLRRAARLTGELLSVVSFGGLAFAIVASAPVLRLVYGAEFAKAAPALPVLLGAFILICYGYLNGDLMMVLGMQTKMVRIGVLALIANVIGNLILVPLTGYIGAAWMTLGTEAVVFVSTSQLLVRELGIRHVPLGRIGRMALAAAGMGLALAALRAIGAPLLVLAASACVLYPALLFALRAIGPEDIQVVLRRRGALA